MTNTEYVAYLQAIRKKTHRISRLADTLVINQPLRVKLIQLSVEIEMDAEALATKAD